MSEQIEATVFVLRDQVQIQKSMQRAAAEDLHLVACCFHWARGDYGAGLEVRHLRIVESLYLKRCYPRNPCHRVSEKGDDDIAMAESCPRVLIHSRSFLPTYVLNSSHYHPPSKLSHFAVAAVLEVLPW